MTKPTALVFVSLWFILTSCATMTVDQSGGVVIDNISAGSPAQLQLQRGDVIHEINRQAIKNVQDYERVLSSMNPDASQVLIMLSRNGNLLFVAVQRFHAQSLVVRDQSSQMAQAPAVSPQVTSVSSAPPSPAVLTSDVDRLSLTDPRGVQVLGKAPPDYVAGTFGKSWAVVIGIDDYEKAPRLKYAVADAKAMAAVLRQQGFQVSELYNRQATKAAVEGELSDKLVDQVGQQDRVVIFYAGHGETKTASGGKTMGYLLPVEGQPDALGRTGVSMGRIKELADALPSKQVLFLVDVCYGGIAGNQFRSTLPPMTVAYLKQITRERGRQLITAGGPDQQALESPEWGHSVFTYYLLEGLGKGLADLNDDGIIPASELYSYLDSRVFSAAQLKGHTQRPELWSLAAEKGEFVFIPSKGR
ncbi:MAG: PDZ domain-containing protein [Nitrospira sp.]|nr:PDZ domain-containing protein [Nitrospira sp.]